MAKLLGICSLVLAITATSIASAAMTSFQPNPVDLNDLDHHEVYTWRINNINLGSETITGASISIKSIANWDSNPNTLFIHLLDTAKQSGVRSFVDDPSNASPVPVSQIIDDFANPRYHNQGAWLVANGTADTFLTSRSFTTTPTDYVYTFTANQLNALNGYVANGKDIALGFDPDCHFDNNGVTFKITTAAVPEPSALVLLGGGIIGLVCRHRTMRRRRIDRDAATAV